MEGTYHLIIRLPYADIPTEFVEWISENARGYLFGQHDADDEVKSTHTHISISDLSKSVKALDKQRQKHNLDGDVSRLLSRVVESKEKYDEQILNIYILKGDVNICKKSNYLPAALEAWAAKWVPKEDLPSVSRGKPLKVVYDEYDIMKKDFLKYYNDMNKPHITLDSIRSWTMRWYWKRDGRMPPATSYKRNAASLYVYATELSNGSIECAFEELKELWY